MAVGFKIARDDRSKGTTELPTSSIAVTIGDLLELIPGASTWTLVATSSLASSRKAIAAQTIASSASTVDAYILDGTELIEAGSTNNSAAADNGDLMIIGTATTGAMVINNTGTTVAATTKESIFEQYQPLGVNTEKRLLGWISVGNGTSPAAS